MKRSILLVTNSFPYGVGETFLATELKFIVECFDEVLIIPNKIVDKKRKRHLPYPNVCLGEPLYKSRLHSLFQIIFNTETIRFIIRELRINISSVSLIRCLEIVLIGLKTRAYASILRSIIRKRIKTQKLLLYFYWANMPSNSSVILDDELNCVVRYHGGDLYEDLHPNGVIFFRKQLLECASLNVFISRYGLNYIKNKYLNIKFNYVVSRLGVISPGLSIKSNDRIFRIVSCSNVTPNKQISLILEALKYLDFDVKWCHFGDGPQLKEILRSVESLPSNIECNFFGNISNELVLEYYINNPVDLFVNVSKSEGIPVSIMEAISAGIPVLATEVGGTNEIVDNSCGELLNPNISAFELAKKFISFYRMEENKSRDLRINAFNKYKNHFDANTQYRSFLKNIIYLIEDREAKDETKNLIFSVDN